MEAVDNVRRQEQSHNELLKRTRYVWLKNPENLTASQYQTLMPLKNLRLKTMRAYNIKLALRDFWSYKYRKSAEGYLKKWYFWATHSRLDPVIECAKAIKNHWKGVTNYIKTKIDNGILEGTNSIIQAAKDSARGFRSTKNFITTIYLKTGKLKFNLPT
jgi:transposase